LDLSLTNSRATQFTKAAVSFLTVATCLGIFVNSDSNGFGFRNYWAGMGKSRHAGSSVGKYSDDRCELHFGLLLLNGSKRVILSCEIFVSR
jgi:hypothetical protein